MSDVVGALVQDYQNRILQEKENYEKAEADKSTAMRNIDRLEGALIGVREVQAKMLSSEGQDAQSETDQQDIEAQD